MDDNVIRLFEDNIDISQVDTNMLSDHLSTGIFIISLTWFFPLITFLLLTLILSYKGKNDFDFLMKIAFVIAGVSTIVMLFISFEPVDKNYESQNWFSENFAKVAPAKYHKETIESFAGAKRVEKSDNTIYDLIEDRFKESFEEKKKELSEFNFDKACAREKTVHKDKEDINVLCDGNNFNSSLIVDGYIFNPEINTAQLDDYKDNTPEELSTDPKNTTVWADIIIEQPNKNSS